ncbi:MAG TPA: ion channel [Polyangiaceae bacterium]
MLSTSSPDIPPPPPRRQGTKPIPRASLLRPDASVEVRRIGLKRSVAQDLYHFLRTSRWTVLILCIAAVFVVANVIFAGLYLLGGDSIANARHGSFEDAFFFSVQTMATIGYGSMTPKNTYANLIATLEAVSGLLLTAVSTGVLFGKFASPQPRVAFSRQALISEADGVPTVMFRIANERANHLIVEARINVTYAYDERDSHGSINRRLIDLPLRRSTTPLFALSWTVFHPIDDKSPFFGQNAESLLDASAGLIITFTGTDDTLATQVHARYAYRAQDFVFGGRFADVLGVDEQGRRYVDHTRFHDVEPPG